MDAIDSAQVDPEVGRKDHGNFLFLNLETLEAKFRIPPNERRRLKRDKLRQVLLQGVADHVHWGKRLRSIELPSGEDGGVRALFEDGSSADGSMLVGAEGTNSQTRKFLAPHNYRNQEIPVRCVGVTVDMTPEQVKVLRDIDPLLFQGCHPATGNFLWVSMLETPEVNGTLGTPNERYQVQMLISWKATGEDDQVPLTDAERVAEMKRRAAEFHPLLRKTIDSIPESTAAVEIVLQDWPCLHWDNCNGRVTLVGDAAHAMTMYRGEAANHGMLDAYHLVQALTKIRTGETSRPAAVTEYEEEMRERVGGEEGAVMLSRMACLDAHDFEGLNENSAVLRRRAIKAS